MSKQLQSIFFRASGLLRKVGKRVDKESFVRYQLVDEWKRQDAERQFRTNYPELGPSSVVVDLGGYEGQWASDIQARYACTVHVFEPMPKFANKIRARFAKNPSIHVHECGLGAKTETVVFSTAADATSAFMQGGAQVSVQLKAADAFLRDLAIDRIHLLKINIEGGEYDLLDHLLATGWAERIDNLQVQFHHFVPQAEARMQAIQQGLAETHELTYQFHFLWENWRRVG